MPIIKKEIKEILIPFSTYISQTNLNKANKIGDDLVKRGVIKKNTRYSLGQYLIETGILHHEVCSGASKKER